MKNELSEKIAKIISSNILTPVIYMIETSEVVDFICFCDRHVTIQEIYDVEKLIKDETGITAEILDIREFGESERLEVINHATLIHSEHPMIETIFTQSMLEDFQLAMDERKDVLDRKKETGTCYLQ